MIQWKERKTNELIWKFPENRVYWNDEIIVGKNQIAGIFSGFKLFSHAKLHAIIREGKKLILPENFPSVLSEFHKNKIVDSFKANVIFCSTSEFDFSGKIYGSESVEALLFEASANAHCKLRISDTSLFLKKVVGEKKNKNTADFLKFLKIHLGKALMSGGRDYLITESDKIGIELVEFTYDSRKEKSYNLGHSP